MGFSPFEFWTQILSFDKNGYWIIILSGFSWKSTAKSTSLIRKDTFMIGVGILFMSFGAHIAMPKLASNMKKPKKFSNVVRISYAIIIVVKLFFTIPGLFLGQLQAKINLLFLLIFSIS